MEREATAYGICKVIQRPSQRFIFAHLNRSLNSTSPIVLLWQSSSVSVVASLLHPMAVLLLPPASSSKRIFF
jgi:hypothetical protein